MSYCRFSDGDVYMFEHVSGGIECCGCLLQKGPEDLFGAILNFATRSQALAHLEEHRRAGHDVPEYAIARLREELAALGDEVRATCRACMHVHQGVELAFICIGCPCEKRGEWAT